MPSNEITLYYHASSRKGKSTYAHAKAIAKHVKAFDYDKNALTAVMFQDLLVKTGRTAKSLLDKSKKEYQANFKGTDYDDEGWLNILLNHPQLIQSPIALYNNRATVCDNPTDIYALTR